MAVERHALNKKERALMHVLLNLAEKNDEGVCLVKPLEIFEALPIRRGCIILHQMLLSLNTEA